MAENDKKEVFISYSTKKYSEEAQYFCNLLEGGGISCWMAPRDIPSGTNWADGIVNGIKDCKLMAFLVSEASAASQEVEKEINLANSFKKTILQVRLENATLSGGLLYHLSNKQWVDAIGDEKATRFKDTLTAIHKLLERKETEVVSDNSTIGQARRLVSELNSSHAKSLDVMNAMFALQEEGHDQFRIFFPLRFGANGLVFFFVFDGTKKKGADFKKVMEFYIDGMSSGDPLQGPFYNEFIKKKFSSDFPESSFRGYRWKCITLIPEAIIPSPLIQPIDALALFKSHMLAMSNRVFPELFNWATYVTSVTQAINKLQDELKLLFPENEGWRVGAPEGERLDGLRSEGKINVFKEEWQPERNNSKRRGWLTITLESGAHFLGDLYVGVIKYEEWHDLGEWQSMIFEACKKLSTDEEVKSKAGWPCLFSLNNPWNDSGIAKNENVWVGEDSPERFVGYCLEKFKVLKELQELVGKACKEIPGMQDKDPSSFLPEQHNNWWTANLYVRNRLRMIADTVRTNFADGDIDVDYRYRGASLWNEVLLKIKEEDFGAAFSFMLYSKEVRIDIADLEPPNFEIAVLNQFLSRNSLDVRLKEKITVEKDCDGGSVEQWMDRVQEFIYQRIQPFSSALKALKKHLQAVVALTEQTKDAFAEVLATGWVIGNQSKSLENAAPINIYKESWRRTGSQPNELPPIMIQIVPESPCFDNLHMVVKLMCPSNSQFDRQLGAICGVCDYALGKGDSSSSLGLWSRRLDEPYCKTGGSSFDKPLLEGKEKEDFFSFLKKSIAENIDKMEPILSEFCQQQNEYDRNALIKTFWDELQLNLEKKYRSTAWKVISNYSGEGSLLITKPEWKDFFKIGFWRFSANTYIGVWCDKNNENISEKYQNIIIDLKAVNGKMRKDPHTWPGWYYTGRDFSQPRDLELLYEHKSAEIVTQYIEMLDTVVQTSVPVIEKYLDITDSTTLPEAENKLGET